MFYFCWMRLIGHIILLFIAFSPFCMWGQSSFKKDSLNTLRCFNAFQKYEYEDTLKSRVYSDSALIYAYRTKSPDLKGRAHQFKGWYYQDCSRFKEANAQYYKSLTFLKKAGNEQGIADAYGNIGNSYLDMDEFQKSLDYQQLSLSANEKIIAKKPKKEALIMAKEGRAYALHNIASIFEQIGLFDQALKYEYKSLDYELERKNMVGAAISYNTLGILHNSLKDKDSAIYYFKKSLEIYKKHKYPYGLASVMHNYALMENSDLSNKEQDQMLRKALEIRRSLGDIDGEMRLLLDVGLKRIDQLSKDSLNEILEVVYPHILGGELDHLSEDYYQLYAYYKSRIGDFDSAYSALESYLDLKEISDVEKHANDLIARDIRFQWESKNLERENEFAAERLKDQEEINRQQNYIYLSVIGLIVVLVSLFFIVQSNRRSRRTNELLSQKNKLINDQKEIVEERNRSISDSINYAKRLQTAILPTPEEVNSQLPNSFLFFKPKDVVSGDFHWFEAKEEAIYIAVADCTGHGVPGAMVSVVCSNAMNQAVNEFGLTSPALILDKTRELVIQRFQKSGEVVVDGMDIVFCAVAKNKQSLVFAGANNPLWIARKNQFIDRNKYDVPTEGAEFSLIEIKGDKQPVGQYARMEPFKEQWVELFPGDTMYLSSDGFADQFGGERGKKFKYAALREFLLSIKNLSMHEQRDCLEQCFENWKGDLEQVDDLCVIGFSVD